MATSNGFLGAALSSCSLRREGGGNKEAGKPRAGSVSDDAAAVGNASGGGQMQIQLISSAKA